jgi:hypothetical protein
VAAPNVQIPIYASKILYMSRVVIELKMRWQCPFTTEPRAHRRLCSNFLSSRCTTKIIQGQSRNTDSLRSITRRIQLGCNT